MPADGAAQPVGAAGDAGGVGMRLPSGLVTLTVVVAALLLLVGGVALGAYGDYQRRLAVARVERTLDLLKALEALQTAADAADAALHDAPRDPSRAGDPGAARAAAAVPRARRALAAASAALTEVERLARLGDASADPARLPAVATVAAAVRAESSLVARGVAVAAALPAAAPTRVDAVAELTTLVDAPAARAARRVRRARVAEAEEAERRRLRDAMARQGAAGDRAARGGISLVVGTVAVMLTGLALLRDAAQRTRRALAQVSAEERRLRGVLDTLPVGVAIADAAGRPTLVNPRLVAIWGDVTEPAAVPITGIADYVRFRARSVDAGHVVEPDDWPLARALRSGTTTHGARYAITRPDGQTATVVIDAAPLTDATGRIVGATAVTTDISAQLAADAARAAALRESEARLRLAVEIARLVVWDRDLASDHLHDRTPVPLAEPEGAEADADARDARPGDRAEAAAGPTARRAPRDFADFLQTVHPDDRAAVAAAHAEAIASGRELRLAHRVVSPDGGVRWLETAARVVADDAGHPARLVGISLDVTERRTLEEQLRQSQKLEAVGRLAGGIAHDFNNLLTVILGNLEFLRADLQRVPDVAPAVADDLHDIWSAADRARGLVQQLLTFSRKQSVRVQRLALGDVVHGAERMLRRVLGDEIELTVEVADAAVAVAADRGQLEQVLVNLAVNARDAMLTPLHGHPGHGGRLLIAVGATRLDAAAAHRLGLAPGAYARLDVRDTGHGMSAATQARIFEPFFTTKDVGAGTGLGLATVHGIVRQAGGEIRVESALGAGTTCTVWLPVAPTDLSTDAPSEASDGRVADAAPDGDAPSGDQRARADGASPPAATVLLVEDEPGVRATTRRTLERHGYAVLEARHGADALLLWRMHAEVVDAVVSDLRMPEMGGRELVALLARDRPALPVVFLSGYDDARQGPLARHERFVAKPYTSAALVAALAGVLAAAAEQPS